MISSLIYRMDQFTLQHFWNFQEQNDGLFESLEKKLSPSNGSSHWRLILNWRLVLLPLKDLICVFHLRWGVREKNRLDHTTYGYYNHDSQCEDKHFIKKNNASLFSKSVETSLNVK